MTVRALAGSGEQGAGSERVVVAPKVIAPPVGRAVRPEPPIVARAGDRWLPKIARIAIAALVLVGVGAGGYGLGIQQGASSVQPQIDTIKLLDDSTSIVTERDNLLQRNAELQSKIDQYELQGDRDSLLRQIDELRALVEARTIALENHLAKPDAKVDSERAPGLGVSLVDYQNALYAEGTWKMLSFNVRDNGDVVHQSVSTNSRKDLLAASGPHDDLRELTVVTNFTDDEDATVAQLTESCNWLCSVGPWTAEEILSWFLARAPECVNSDKPYYVVRGRHHLSLIFIPNKDGNMGIFSIGTGPIEYKDHVEDWGDFVTSLSD
jgi:hypothetical protein